MSLATLFQDYREVFISLSVGILAAVGDLLFGAFEEGEPFMVHVARHGGLDSVHMVEHYFFVFGSLLMGFLWWEAGHGYRVEKEAKLEEMKRHREYVDEVADNLRNPLQVIKGHFEIFDRRGLSKEQEKQLDLIVKTCREIESNVKKLTKGPGGED